MDLHISKKTEKNNMLDLTLSHPGTQQGEVFIGYYLPIHYEGIKLKTKRFSCDIYDIAKRRIIISPPDSLYAAFASESEYRKVNGK